MRFRRRLALAALGMVVMSGCANPQAVQTFAAMAPDRAIAAGLAQAYAAQPAWTDELSGLWAPNAVLPVNDRAAQVQAVTGIDQVIRQYMAALGALVAGTVAQPAKSVAGLKAGLAALQQAEPRLLSPTSVAAVGSLAQLVDGIAESGYRSASLARVIGEANAPFQQVLDAQIAIVQRGILPSLAEYAHGYDGAQPNLAAASPVLRYVANRQLRADTAQAAIQIAAATAYVRALADIKAAHAALYAHRTHLLSVAISP